MGPAVPLETGTGAFPLPAPPHWLGLGMAPLRPAIIPPPSLASWRAFAAVAAPVVRPGDPQATPEGRWQLSPRALWPKDEPLRSKLNPQLRVPLASFMGKSMGHFPFPTQVSSAGAPQGQEHMGNPPCQAPPGPQPERMWVTLHGPPRSTSLRAQPAPSRLCSPSLA